MLLAQLNASLGNWDSAVTFYYSYWANGTATPPVSANWEGMILWQGDDSTTLSTGERSIILMYPSLISMNSTRRLFDPGISLSFLSLSLSLSSLLSPLSLSLSLSLSLFINISFYSCSKFLVEFDTRYQWQCMGRCPQFNDCKADVDDRI